MDVLTKLLIFFTIKLDQLKTFNRFAMNFKTSFPCNQLWKDRTQLFDTFSTALLFEVRRSIPLSYFQSSTLNPALPSASAISLLHDGMRCPPHCVTFVLCCVTLPCKPPSVHVPTPELHFEENEWSWGAIKLSRRILKWEFLSDAVQLFSRENPQSQT